MENIKVKYKLATKNIQYPNSIKWLQLSFLAIQRLKKIIPEKKLFRYVLEHIIDQVYNEKELLINYIFFNDALTPFEKTIKQYLTKFVFSKKQLKGILLLKQNTLKFYIFDKKQIRLPLPTEYIELKDQIKKKSQELYLLMLIHYFYVT